MKSFYFSLDGAAVEKNRLEEKQRAARKDRKKSKGEWTPRYVRSGQKAKSSLETNCQISTFRKVFLKTG